METQTPSPQVRRDRTHYLYLAVIVAVLAGIAVGLLFPHLGVQLKPLGTGFVKLIQMMIAPVIFCTIVIGVGSIRQAAKVGRVEPTPSTIVQKMTGAIIIWMSLTNPVPTGLS